MITKSKRFFLHIGAPKTGTTALQTFFSENRPALLRQGLLYPEACLRANGHHDLAFLLGGGYPDWAIPQEKEIGQLLGDLGKEVSNHSGAILLSSENFYLLTDPTELAGALESCRIVPHYQIVIVVYLRPQHEAHESWYNQTIKAQGFTHSLEECLNAFHSLWDYDRMLDKWAEAFGAGNIIVRPYERRAGIAADVRTDLLELLELAPNDFKHSADRDNISINRDILEFQRLLNRQPLSIPEKRQFHRELMRLSAENQYKQFFDNGPLLSISQRQQIMEEYEPGNRRVALRYLGREMLFREDFPKVDRDYSSYAGLTEEKMTWILNWIMVSITNASRGLDPENS